MTLRTASPNHAVIPERPAMTKARRGPRIRVRTHGARAAWRALRPRARRAGRLRANGFAGLRPERRAECGSPAATLRVIQPYASGRRFRLPLGSCAVHFSASLSVSRSLLEIAPDFPLQKKKWTRRLPGGCTRRRGQCSDERRQQRDQFALGTGAGRCCLHYLGCVKSSGGGRHQTGGGCRGADRGSRELVFGGGADRRRGHCAWRGRDGVPASTSGRERGPRIKIMLGLQAVSAPRVVEPATWFGPWRSLAKLRFMHV